MKKTNITKLAFTWLTLGALYFLPSCNFIANNENKNKMHMVVEISTPGTSVNDINEMQNAMNSTIELFRSRLNGIDIKKVDIQPLDVSKGLISIDLLGVSSPERVRKQILSHAYLELWETAELEEILTNVIAINDMAREIEEAQPAVQEEQKVEETKENEPKEEDEWTRAFDSIYASNKSDEENETQNLNNEELDKRNPLFKLLFMNINIMSGHGTPYSGPTIGHASAKDTAKISEYFKLAKEKGIFPSNIYPIWTPRTNSYDEETLFELVALKSSGEERKPALSGNIIKKANAERNNYGQNYVSFEMTSDASVIWEDLTGKNVGKTIAIVLDGHVCTAPRVNSAITGGKCSISGEFTKEETEEIAALLNSGPLNVSTKIIEETIDTPVIAFQ
ncbi:MAG: hypothetical protein J6S89_00115 [Paludibacteraceae bacterium]|nr:hypothetical protein [Paludibacteraceae bacterium]